MGIKIFPAPEKKGLPLLIFNGRFIFPVFYILLAASGLKEKWNLNNLSPMNNYDVYFYEAFAEEQEKLKHYLPADIKAGFTGKTIQEAAHQAAPAPVVSIRTQSLIPPEWASSLRGLLTRSTGYDHVKLYRDKNNPTLFCGYLPLYCHRAVAEHALMLWMALLRKLPQQQRQFITFHRDGLTGSECEKKTLVVFGVGNIGYELTRIGRGLGMTVLGVDIEHTHNDVDYVTPEDGLRRANIIVSAMNLTADTKNYFTAEKFSMVRPGVIFVNVSRGEISPAATLLAQLDGGRVAGIGLDVYNEESELAVSLRSKKESANPEVRALLELCRRDAVITTPHNAFNTTESVDRKSAQSVEQLQSLSKKGVFLWPVP